MTQVSSAYFVGFPFFPGHGIITAVVLTDLLAFSPVPKLRRQFVFPILFAVTWFTFSYVYYAAGGLGLKVHDDEPPLDGEPYLYKARNSSLFTIGP